MTHNLFSLLPKNHFRRGNLEQGIGDFSIFALLHISSWSARYVCNDTEMSEFPQGVKQVVVGLEVLSSRLK